MILIQIHLAFTLKNAKIPWNLPHKSWNFVTPEKWKPWLLFNREGFFPRKSAPELVCSILLSFGGSSATNFLKLYLSLVQHEKNSMNLQSEKLWLFLKLGFGRKWTDEKGSRRHGTSGGIRTLEATQLEVQLNSWADQRPRLSHDHQCLTYCEV